MLRLESPSATTLTIFTNILQITNIRNNKCRNKKSGPVNRTALKEINMINTNINDELQKYLDVLKNVKRYKDGYMATCPNEDAHNWKREKRPPTQNFQLGIQKTKGENVEKFGEYMVVYRCHAHGEGPCSNKVLAGLFKQHGIQSHTFNKLPPEVFPKGDDSYLKFNRIGERNSGLFFYRGTDDDIFFLEWQLEDRITKEKKLYPLSYSKFATKNPDMKGEGGWVKEYLWESRPIYKQNEIWLTKKNKCIIVDEATSVAMAEEFFPDYFITCCSSGAKGWRTSDILNVIRFNDIVCLPKNTNEYKKQFKDLALYIGSKGIKTRVVDLPKELPLGWNLTKHIPESINLDELISSAKPPKVREKNDYSNIEEDIVKGRWTHLTASRKYYYDHFKNEIAHKENLNDWYEADTKTKRAGKAPTKYMHRKGCPRAEGLAFIPNNEKIIWRENKKYINSYVPPKHKELTQEEIDKIDNKAFLHEIDILCNFDKEVSTFFKDTIAFTVQHPDKNLKYATLVVSDSEGTGKSFVWKGIYNMMGGSRYCIPLETEQLTSKLGRSWIQDKHILICHEIEIVGTKPEVRRQINSIKNLVVEDIHSCEPKGVDPFQVYNHFNCFFSSNEEIQAIIGDIKTRRWFVTTCLMEREDIEREYPTHFGELEKFVNDKEKIAGLYYFFKNQYTISKEYKPWQALITQSKKDMAYRIMPQLWKNVDVFKKSKTGVFKKDFVRVKKVYEYFRDLGEENRTLKWISFNENECEDYLKRVGKKMKNGEGIPLGEGKERHRDWYIIRNIPFWINQKGLTNHRLHLAGRYFAPEFTNKQEELNAHASKEASTTTINERDNNAYSTTKSIINTE